MMLSRSGLLTGMLCILTPGLFAGDCPSSEASYERVRAAFVDLPLAEKTTGPLYWVQEKGNGSDVDREYVHIMLEGGNGQCTIESRIYKEWLDPSWFEIVDVILNEMKKRGAKAYIFDEAWFPSFDVAGKVPPEHRTKLLNCDTEEVVGPRKYTASGHAGEQYIKTVAGKVLEGGIDPGRLKDLTPHIADGDLAWSVPSGTWQIMKFTWTYNTDWGKPRLLDLASQDAADWFVDSVIKPHYEKTTAPDAILGFFYDEPEFWGQWGKGMEGDTTHWKEMLVHRFHPLAGEAQKKAQYIYMEALADRIGRVGYGTYRDFVRARGGKVIGHFWEHNHPLGWGMGPIDIMEVQKYSDMGGIDYVAPGTAAPEWRSKRKGILHQMARLGSSIAITNDMEGHLAMNEIYAGYPLGDYAFVKWSSDLSTVQGSQYLIPHSFNPGNYEEGDWPPYFYRSGTEPSWPLYKVWAERQNRLSYMLHGNDADDYRIAPVAVIWGGISSHVGRYTLPYNLLSAFESANYDPLLMTSNRFETDAQISSKTRSIELFNSSFKVLVLPSAEYIPHRTLEKAREFYDAGGVVMSWGSLPSRSAKFDATDQDVRKTMARLFGSEKPVAGAEPIKTNRRGGKTFHLGDEGPVDALTGRVKAALRQCGVESTFTVLRGVTPEEEWVMYQHRKREGHDVFMIWNGNGEARNITARLKATGFPEIWHPTSLSISPAVYERVDSDTVDIKCHLNRDEAVLVVFNPSGSTTSVCQTDVHRVVGIQGEGAQARVRVEVSENKDYTVFLRQGETYFRKDFSERTVPTALPIVNGEVDVHPVCLSDGHRWYVDVGSATSARVNVNQDYVPLEGNGGFAGGVLTSSRLVDVSDHLRAGPNRIQLQPEDPGDARVLICLPITLSGFQPCPKPVAPPTFASDLEGGGFLAGERIALRVSTAAPASFQWFGPRGSIQKDDDYEVSVEGDSSTLTIGEFSQELAGSYHCEAKNDGGATRSREVHLTEVRQVAHWPFDDGVEETSLVAPTVLQNFGGNLPKLSTESTKGGGAILFDGTAAVLDILIEEGSPLDLSSFTMTCWLKLFEQGQNEAGYERLFNFNDGLFYDLAVDEATDTFRISGLNDLGISAWTDVPSKLKAGKWFSLSQSYDGLTGRCEIHLDGERIFQHDAAPGLKMLGSGIRVGGFYHAGHGENGKQNGAFYLDDLKIFTGQLRRGG